MQRMFPDDLRTANVDGTNIAYVERGTGAPLVLAHGRVQPQVRKTERGHPCRAG
jgi:hypothetical protein